MKHIGKYILQLSLLTWVVMPVYGDVSCEWIRKIMNYPYYYCDCHDKSTSFEFGLDMVITDTTWFDASTDQLRQGLTAYWFANSSVTMEVYVFCSSSEPSFTVTVGQNSMKEMDVSEINQKIEKMGELAETMMQVLTPHIRVYPRNGGTGRVLCYPFEEGPHSTCDDIMNVVNGMTYVSNHDDDVYCLTAATKRADNMFVQWKQEKNQPCELYVTSGACDGPEIARVTLHDSTKVFFPGKDMLQMAKAENKALYFHFTHKAEDVGRITFRTYPKLFQDTVQQTLCRGLGIELVDTTLRETTKYLDTAWVVRDTLMETLYDLTIKEPVQKSETIGITTKQLPYFYRNAKLIDDFGVYDVLIQRPNQCDEYYRLNLKHQPVFVKTNSQVDICQGKTYTMDNGKIVTRDTAIVDSIWHDVDTCHIASMKIHFVEPEVEENVVYLTEEELADYYFMGKPYDHFGEYSIVYQYPNTCTRKIHLVLKDKNAPTDIFATDAEAEGAPVRKILYKGNICIEINGQIYSILGNKIN